jgi:hypothetical protein
LHFGDVDLEIVPGSGLVPVFIQNPLFIPLMSAIFIAASKKPQRYSALL